MAPIIGSKTIYTSHNLRYLYSIIANKLTRTIDFKLSYPHQDTKIVFLRCEQTDDTTVIIRTSNTDIVAIMLANMQHLHT